MNYYVFVQDSKVKDFHGIISHDDEIIEAGEIQELFELCDC